MADAPGRIIVLRHGQTEWSRDGRHTGLTDIPLTADGEAQSSALTERFARLDIALCLSSPLLRAWRTAELAGLHPVACPALVERHYGPVEGRSTEHVRAASGDPGWDVWDDDLTEVPGVSPPADAFQGPGESLAAVALRLEPVLQRCADAITGGRDCVLVSHSHLLRVLAACWLRQEPTLARHLVLQAAHLGVLGYERATPALLGWDLPA